MGKISVHGKRLSLVLNGIGAIAFVTWGGLSGQAAELRHPALTSLSRYSAQQNIQPSTKQLVPEDGSAEDLKPSSASQSDDPPDLPILEPSILLDQPVSVPPIEPLEVPAAPTSGMPTVSVPPIAPPIVASPPAEAVEPLEPIEPIESIEPIEPIETAETTIPAEASDAAETAAGPTQNESEIPLEPPFIGDLAEQTDPSTTSETAPALMPDPTTPPTLSVPTAPLPTETLASGSPPLLPAIAEPTETEPTVTEPVPTVLPTVRPANTNRWPDPIPFGQPLPNTQRN